MDDLLAARNQMAVSLGFHIVFACIGIALPALMLYAERRGWGDDEAAKDWDRLARRWSKAFAVLFAVGAVSGTVLSFELGLLWPTFMGTYGAVVGLPFTAEGFAFFLEAIFLGIYLYGRDRLSPRAHWWSGVPILVSGVASAFFVVSANAWMNVPRGFRQTAAGEVVDVRPLAAMFNPATPPQATHMIVAAFMATGFAVAGVYAAAMLRGRRDGYVRRGMAAGLVVALALAPVQVLVGDWAARFVARQQPVKLAALEGQFRTERGAPLRIGGLPDEGREQTRFALEIPRGLSIIAYRDPDAVVPGLDQVPARDRPPVAVVHLAFQVMVALGFAFLGLAVWVAGVALRRRRRGTRGLALLPDGRWFLRAVVAAGVGGFVAVEAGWVVTEVGRQPFIAYGLMRTADAVTSRGNLVVDLAVVTTIYLALSAITVVTLRRMAARG